MEKTKKCKYCKTEIPADAKVCPQCRRKLKGGKLKWVILIILIWAIIGAVAGENDSKNSTTASTSSNSSEKKEEVSTIEYTSVSVNDMMADLENNALGASDKYKDQYLEITGRLGVIDSSGKYISLYPDDEFALIGVQCYIKNDEQKSKVSAMKKGDTVTLKGKCTNVGEVLGYSLDIEEIK
mgnify:CR=1 FL=1